jgi:hypothetical protein
MSTLALSRVTAGQTISATTENNNQAALEAAINGGIEAANIADDAVTAAKLNSDVPRSGYGLSQHTDGTLMVDPSDTNPGLEATDGGLRVKVDNSSIERAAGGIQVKAGGITVAMLAASTLAAAYPVGSVYINASVATNPATLLGFGTWTAFGAGRVMIGNGTSDATYAAGATGGESTHTLTVAEMPAHTHTEKGDTGDGSADGGNTLHKHHQDMNTGSTGGGGAHNNLPPYIVCYFWQRTA